MSTVTHPGRRLTFALVCALGACATPIDLPDSFVELQDNGQGFRAVTSDDARVWVRELYDSTEASVDFWTETLRRDFVDGRGYELRGEGEVLDRDGDSGRWLELTGNVGGERVDYLVALWVDRGWLGGGNRLKVVEFAARHEVFTARVDAVRAALATVR